MVRPKVVSHQRVGSELRERVFDTYERLYFNSQTDGPLCVISLPFSRKHTKENIHVYRGATK